MRNPFANETVKKVMVDIGVFTVSGLICVAGSAFLMSKFLLPKLTHAAPAPAPAATAAPEGDPHAAASAEKAPDAEPAVAPAAEGHGEKAPEKAGGEHGKAPAPSKGTHFPLKPVIVNLAGDAVRRYAKVTMTLDMSEGKVADELEKSEPQVYDTLIRVVSKYRFEEINTPEGKETLKEEVKNRLSSMLKHGTISNVYITELIVQ